MVHVCMVIMKTHLLLHKCMHTELHVIADLYYLAGRSTHFQVGGDNLKVRGRCWRCH